ncbi:sensor domain-containing diguanylate cyclase [Sediminibacillus albus]|uniref:Diguanylate cyclase (GGDEF) domain-containing protein n=1 Tax=Sediminibacillus albus TaxID=407036 RepID=A0A1G9BXM0_9BACI|nr:sensor domain-containing diguanylate cyclase [Sediminibacillus albus]SDK43705.1 diguanylate cyclase (GGDEF) domain-containing protein [Sediminibacillus albus]
MKTNNRQARFEFWNYIIEGFINESNVSVDTKVTEICRKVKQFLSLEYAAVYLYDPWKNSYFLHTDSEKDEEVLLSELAEEAVNMNNTPFDNRKIFSGKPVLKEQTFLDSLLISLEEDEVIVGYFFAATVNSEHMETNILEFQEVAGEISSVINSMNVHARMAQNANRFEVLYRVTAKFHSSINTNHVLGEVINTLKGVYPRFEYFLFLSQDFPSNGELPIKELIYNDNVTNKVSVHAFLTGEVQIEEDHEVSETCLYAPLKGTQGVYGVLQIISPAAVVFPKEEVEFITSLANAAGNALENTRLYQQSKQLIEDLQLINETSHTLNSNLRLIETTSFMNRQIKDKFGAQEIGFILYKEDEEEEYEILDGSTDYFLLKGSNKFLPTILDLLQKQHDSVFIGDFSIKYPNIPLPFHSVMAIPMVQSKQIKGAIIALHKQPYYFSFESFKLIQSLVHHSTLAFVNSMLREKLEHLVITDYLTSLYSRKYLDEQLQEHLKSDEQGSFLLIDIDDFKKFNDTYGHEVGDELIIQVANIMKGHLGKEDFAARWGGEELAVYLPNASMEDGLETAHQLVRQVEAFTEPTVTISVGVSSWEKNHKDLARSIFDRADEALYEAKKLGKNCVAKAKHTAE